MVKPVSLIDRSLLLVAGVALLAVLVPVWLVQDDTTPEIADAPRPAVTALQVVEPPALSAATTRPALSPTRNTETEVPPPEMVPAVTPPEAQPAPPPTLVGLVVGGGRRGVAILKSTTGESANLRVGDELDGWRLVSVGRNQAVIDLNGRRETLTLTFPNRDRPAAAAAASAAPLSTLTPDAQD